MGNPETEFENKGRFSPGVHLLFGIKSNQPPEEWGHSGILFNLGGKTLEIRSGANNSAGAY
jgi:hypothetical protein